MQSAQTPHFTPTEIRLQAMLADQRVLLEEKQRTIDTLQEQLRLALRRQFGPRHEFVDVDQISLLEGVIDDTQLLKPADDESKADAAGAPDGKADDKGDTEPKTRRQPIRYLKDLERDIRVIDLPEADKVCSCCGLPLEHIGDECSEQLQYNPASLRILETRRMKYGCRHNECRGEIKRAPVETLPPIPKAMASASLLAYLIVSKFADHRVL